MPLLYLQHGGVSPSAPLLKLMPHQIQVWDELISANGAEIQLLADQDISGAVRCAGSATETAARRILRIAHLHAARPAVVRNEAARNNADGGNA